MAVRRVVTGHDRAGRSVLIEDGAVEPITMDLFPGFEQHAIWSADDTATVPAGPPSATRFYFPPVNGIRFQVITFPPDSVAQPWDEDADAEAALAQLEEAAPGMAAHFEPGKPGMHTSDTVDYMYIVSGTICLELDDGIEVELHAGDTVVQQGTRHAWRNRGEIPCVVAGTLVGARRAG